MTILPELRDALVRARPPVILPELRDGLVARPAPARARRRPVLIGGSPLPACSPRRARSPRPASCRSRGDPVEPKHVNRDPARGIGVPVGAPRGCCRCASPDPAGGPPWGMRMVTTSRGLAVPAGRARRRGPARRARPGRHRGQRRALPPAPDRRPRAARSPRARSPTARAGSSPASTGSPTRAATRRCAPAAGAS